MQSSETIIILQAFVFPDIGRESDFSIDNLFQMLDLLFRFAGVAMINTFSVAYSV